MIRELGVVPLQQPVKHGHCVLELTQAREVQPPQVAAGGRQQPYEHLERKGRRQVHQEEARDEAHALAVAHLQRSQQASAVQLLRLRSTLAGSACSGAAPAASTRYTAYDEIHRCTKNLPRQAHANHIPPAPPKPTPRRHDNEQVGRRASMSSMLYALSTL